MRGRTNITPRTVPKVNASVEEYEVETGYTVRTGDFVEIVYNENYGSFTQMNGKKYEKINDELFVISNSNQISLFKIQGSSFQRVNQITFNSGNNTRFGLSVYNGNIFVTTNNKLLNFDIENNLLVLKEEIALTNSSYGYQNCTDEYGNLFVVTQNRIIVYEVVDGNLILNQEFALSYTAIADCKIVNGNLVITCGTGSYSTLYEQVDCYDIVYSGNNVSSISLKNSLDVFNNESIGYKLEILNLFVLQNYVSFVTINGSNNYIELYEIGNQGVALLSRKSISGINNSFNKLNNECLICFNGTNCSIYKINSLTLEFELLNTYNNMLSSSSGEVSAYFPDIDVIYDERIIHINYNSFHLFTFANNVLRKGWTTSPVAKVKPYSNGSAIGFAKIGGSSGETIKVYVP